MVVSNKSFTREGRLMAALIGLLWLAGGVLALVAAVTHRQGVLGVVAVGALGVAVFYLVAAWRGRPWHVGRSSRQ